MYPAFPRERSFSTNHLEDGEHTGPDGNSKLDHSPADYTVPLFRAHDVAAFDVWSARRLPPLSAMRVLNLFGDESSIEAIAATAAQLQRRT